MTRFLQPFAGFLLSASLGAAAAHPLPAQAMLHPDYPVVSGAYRLTSEWSIALPDSFNRRTEDGSLVLWRPGVTLWINVWKNDRHQSIAERLHQMQQGRNPDAFDVAVAADVSPARYSYRLNEVEEGSTRYALYGFVVGPNGHLQVAIYIDREEDLRMAKALLASIALAT